MLEKMMGTRSVITVYENEQALLSMYGQYDGYPEGVGLSLAQFLDSGQLINGFTSGDEGNFNGAGCLAAQLVCHFKKDVGGFYIVPVGETESFNYHVYVSRKENGSYNKIKVVIDDGFGKQIFAGTVKKMLKFCEKK